MSLLITGSGGPLGVNFTRSIQAAQSGRRLVGTDANRWHLPLSLCEQTYLIPYASDLDNYCQALNEIATKEGVSALLPTHPVEVRAVAALRDQGRLGELGVALPASAVLEIAGDKRATQEMLLEADVPVPKSLRIESRQDIERAFDELTCANSAVPTDGQTIWVRGAGAPGLGIGGAALPCLDPDTAIAWVEHHDGWGKMAASEYLPGANLTWMAVFGEGVLLAAGARQRLEYVLPHIAPSGVTGAPAVSRTIEASRVSAIGERAVRAIDPHPHGSYFVDLKGDLADSPRVTEINAGRCGTTVHFYTAAGFNFPMLLAELALGLDPKPLADPNSAIEPDLYWVRTLDCGPALVRGDAGFDDYPRAGPR